MSGPDLVERMKSQGLKFRALYVSGYTNNAIQHQGVLSSGVNFLSKPYTAAGLLGKVREVLDGH